MLDYKGRAHTTKINTSPQPILTSNGLTPSEGSHQDTAPTTNQSQEEVDVEQIKQTLKGIYIHLTKYMKELLKKFNMGDAKEMKTPMHAPHDIPWIGRGIIKGGRDSVQSND